MLKQVASGVAIWTLFVACGLASQESSPAPAVQRRSPPAVLPPAIPANSPDRARVPDAVHEVRALDHHARTGMICFAGAFGGPVKREPLPLFALGPKPQLKRR
jgi:hypothetical protein